MRIKRITSQHRRDFHAVYECEHCDHTYYGYGYDDAHFHQNVIPSKVCPVCKKTSGDDYRPLATKYPAGQVV